MDEKMKKLLTPINIGNVTVKNRFFVGPMGIDYNNGAYSEPTAENIEYFVERSKGGFGAIFTGCMIPDNVTSDKVAGKSMLNNPNAARLAFTALTERLAAYDTKLFAQLTFGAGRNYPTMLAPSAVEAYKYPMFKSVEMTKDDIKAKEESIIKAAAIMKSAGVAGVDFHALHWGYLLDCFAMAITNKREDEYGGALENRLRIVKETIDGIHQECGADYPVTMRLGLKSYIKALNKASLDGSDEAGRTLEEGIRIAKLLEEMGFAALSVDVGIYDSFYHACPPSYMPKGHALKLYAECKKAVSIPVLGGSRMGDPYLCADALDKGMCDGFVLSRPALADPYFARKVEMGEPEKIRPCIGCNMGCIGRLLEKGLPQTCAVNPRANRELLTRPKKAAEPKNIIIVGAGVGGMEAARTGKMCGHSVEIYEKSGVVGGQLNAAGAHDFKADIHGLRDWYIRELKELNVPIHLNSEVTPELVKEKKADVIIFATGASPVMPRSIAGIEKAASAVDVLEGKKAVGDSVVVVGGGMVGCETAVDLANHGKKVTLVEALDNILSSDFVPQQHSMMLKDLIEDRKIDVITGHKLVAVTDSGAELECVASGEKKSVPADTTVISIGLKPNPIDVSEFYGLGAQVYKIGSAKRAGNVIDAVGEAFEVVYNLD